MESALIITSSEKSFASIAELLRAHSFLDAVHAGSGGEGRRLLLDRDFNLVFISMPLSDENGEDLSRKIAADEASQVILAVKSEIYDQVSAVCERDGVFVIEKPLNRDVLRQVISMTRTMRSRYLRTQAENENLRQKIDEIRIIDRAKNILISAARMSEHEAHRYMEKKAMDTRTSKRRVCEGIIHDYEYGVD